MFLFIIFLPCVATLWTFWKDSTAILSAFCRKYVHLECQQQTFNILKSISRLYLSKNIHFHSSTYIYRHTHHRIWKSPLFFVTIFPFRTSEQIQILVFPPQVYLHPFFYVHSQWITLNQLALSLSPLSFCCFDKWNKFHPYAPHIPMPVSSNFSCNKAHTSSNCTTVSHPNQSLTKWEH